MKKPLVSVIVPIYNVDKYLDECISSIAFSSLSDIEILLINDGSKDKSYEICKRWEDKDNRIKFFTKKNGGLSDARNYGIERATGEYFAFVDSDDKIHKDMLKKLYESCLRNNTKVAICNLYLWYKNKSVIVSDLTSFFEKEKIDYNIFSDMFHNTAWRKIYHYSLFNDKNLRFPFGITHEDIGFWWFIMAKITEISIVDEPLYYYRQNNMSSISMQNNQLKKQTDIFFSFEFGLYNGMKNISANNREKYLRKFFSTYAEFVSLENVSSVIVARHNNIISILKENNISIPDSYQYYYDAKTTPIFSIRILKSAKKNYLNLFIRIYNIKIFQLVIGKSE